MMMGAGRIRVNLNVFGANQYTLPQQAKQLSVYFTLQYLILKCGSVIGRLVLPILRQDVKCFGATDCYSLTFGVTSMVMFIGFVCLVSGSSSYVKKPPSGNMLIKVFKCIAVRVVEGSVSFLFDGFKFTSSLEFQEKSERNSAAQTQSPTGSIMPMRSSATKSLATPRPS